VLEAARQLTGARYAALGILDRERHKLERFVTTGLDDSTRQQIDALPRGRGILGELIVDPRPLRLADLGQHPCAYGFPSGHPVMKTFLGVPVFVGGKPFGNLYLTDKQRGEEFTAEDEQAAVRLAELAGLAIDHARRHASGIAAARSVELVSQRIAAAEQERARWARELHDETLQTLAALRLGLATALQQGDSQMLTEVVQDTVVKLQSEVANLRSVITELRPTTLDDYGLPAALEVLAERGRRDGLDVEVRIDPGGGEWERHDSELETALYRITQEALVNADQHSGARRVLLEVRTSDDCIEVVTRDDGHGFDPCARTAGLGLHSMHERAELLGGTLTISSAPGRGTHVTANLPTRPARSRRLSLVDRDPPALGSVVGGGGSTSVRADG
jgi:signal transduction histidine kinase